MALRQLYPRPRHEPARTESDSELDALFDEVFSNAASDGSFGTTHDGNFIAASTADQGEPSPSLTPFRFEDLPWKIQRQILKLVVVTDVIVQVRDDESMNFDIRTSRDLVHMRNSQSGSPFNLAILRANRRLNRDGTRYFWSDSLFHFVLQQSEDERYIQKFLGVGYRHMDATIFMRDPIEDTTDPAADFPRITDIATPLKLQQVPQGALMQRVTFDSLPKQMGSRNLCPVHKVYPRNWMCQFKILHAMEQLRSKIVPQWSDLPQRKTTKLSRFLEKLDEIEGSQVRNVVGPQLNGLITTSPVAFSRKEGLDEVTLMFSMSELTEGCHRLGAQIKFVDSGDDIYQMDRVVEEWPPKANGAANIARNVILKRLPEGEMGYRLAQLANIYLTNGWKSMDVTFEPLVKYIDMKGFPMSIVNGRMLPKHDTPQFPQPGTFEMATLPKELLMRILRYLVVTPTPIMNGSTKHISELPELIRRESCETAHVEILRTCKRIHDLGIQVLHEENEFVFSSLDKYSRFIRKQVRVYPDEKNAWWKDRNSVMKEIIIDRHVSERDTYRMRNPLMRAFPQPVQREEIWRRIRATEFNLRKFTILFDSRYGFFLQSMMKFLHAGLMTLAQPGQGLPSIRWKRTQEPGGITRWEARLPRFDWQQMNTMRFVLVGWFHDQAVGQNPLEGMLRAAAEEVGLGFEVDYVKQSSTPATTKKYDDDDSSEDEDILELCRPRALRVRAPQVDPSHDSTWRRDRRVARPVRCPAGIASESQDTSKPHVGFESQLFQAMAASLPTAQPPAASTLLRP